MQAGEGTGGAVQPGEVFVGRERELAEVVDAVAAAADQGGSAVVIRGEAGIGKSELLAHCVEALVEQQWHVVYLRSDELQRRIPYAALGEALLSADFGRSADLRGLVEELAAVLDVAAHQPLPSVYGATTRLFSALRDEAPTLIAVDDLHVIDDDTLVVVAGLLRRQARHPLALLGALRTREVKSGALALMLERLARDRQLKTVDLGPLDAEATASLVAALLGGRPDGDLVELIQDKSSGNPFFATQTVLDLAESGAIVVGAAGCRLESGPSPYPLSEDRRSAVLHRVLRVGEDARRLARALALLGAIPLSRLRLAAELASLSVPRAERAFDGLVERGLLRSGPDEVYRFCHETVRDALFHEMGLAERLRWHRLAADWLRDLPSSPAVDLEVAHHLAEIAEPGDEDAVAVLTRVAEHTCTTAPHSSIPWFRRALAIIPPDDPRHPELTGRLARALFLAGRPREAADTGRTALLRLPVGESRSRVVTLMIEALIEISEIEEASELIDSERAKGTGGIRLLGQAAYVLALSDRLPESDDAGDEVFVALDRHGPAERVNALVHLAHKCVLVGRFGSLPPLWDALREAAAQAPVTAELNAYAAMSYVLAVQGDTRACSAALVRAQELLVESGWSLYRAELAAAQAQNASNAGEWDTALSIVEATAGELEDSGAVAFLTMLRSIEVDILANRGEWATGRRLAEQTLSPHPTYAAIHACARAEIDIVSRDLVAARSLLERHLTDGRTPGTRSLLISLAEVAAEAGDADEVERRLAELEQAGWEPCDYIGFVRCRLASGRVREDLDALHEAAKAAEEHGLVLLQGRARLALGTAGEDPEGNLRAAARVFQSLGALPWRRRANAELRRRGLKVPRHRLASTTLLTETEVQIARLVQLGRPNREIALTVSLSVKTVEAYLSRIYAKTGCSTRLELARALDKGLLD